MRYFNEDIKNKTILFCPLNWGLGHATRCMPLINEARSNNASVIIAADGICSEFLKREYPQLKHVYLQGYDIKYPGNGNMALSMALQGSRILYRIYKEHKALGNIVKENGVDIVISDNRFGCWNTAVRSIYITHQINIQAPRGKGIIRRINHWFINKYNECWIPDYEGTENLAGELSHTNLPENAGYIGPLSDFTTCVDPTTDITYDITVLLSGPEPQRSILEEKILLQVQNSTKKILIIGGTTQPQKETPLPANVTYVSLANRKQLCQWLQQSDLIICRPGYSTVMDLHVLNKQKVIFIPTPGQTEQEYLAGLFSGKENVLCINQADFNFTEAIAQLSPSI